MGACSRPMRRRLIPYLLLLAVLAGGLLWHASEMLPGLGRTIVSGQAAVGGPFALTDQDGKARTSADFRGQYHADLFRL